jgi:hypothetical protein
MSLTEADTVFAGVNESALNDVFRALLTTRAHYLNHGSPPLITMDTAAATTHSPIPLPGVPGGIPWAFHFDVPEIDIFPHTSGDIPPEIVLAEGQFTLRTTATLRLLCGDGISTDGGPPEHRVQLAVWALGEFDFGADDVGFVLRSAELVDIAPTPLEDLLECLIRHVLGGLLAGIRLPRSAIVAGAFALTLTRPPVVGDDQLKLYGRV